MPILVKRATTVASTANTTWSNTNNAVDVTGDGNYATWVNAARSVSGTITVNVPSMGVPAGATINSVLVRLRHFVSSTTLITSANVSVSGGTATSFATPLPSAAPPVGTGQTVAVPAPADLNVTNTLALTAVRSNSTTSSTWSVDWAELEVDYTAAALPPATPTGIFRHSVISPTSIRVVWGYDQGVAGYELMEARDAAFTQSVKTYIPTPDPTHNQVYTSGMVSGVDYYYRVRAKNSSNVYSGWSETLVTQSEAPFYGFGVPF